MLTDYTLHVEIAILPNVLLHLGRPVLKGQVLMPLHCGSHAMGVACYTTNIHPTFRKCSPVYNQAAGTKRAGNYGIIDYTLQV